MPKYILDPCVEDEIWGIWQFMAQDNPDAATRFDPLPPGVTDVRLHRVQVQG